MRYLILGIIVQIGVFSTVFGQKVKIEIEERQCKLDEKIEVKFVIDFNEDSIKVSDFNGFDLIGGTSTSTSISIINGEKQYSKSWTYYLRPLTSGDLIIESPIFYYCSKQIKDTKTIVVSESDLTEKEKQDIKFNAFVEDSFKPDGTLRYTVNDSFGYIEIFHDYKWNFYRRLTDYEMSILTKLK